MANDQTQAFFEDLSENLENQIHDFGRMSTGNSALSQGSSKSWQNRELDTNG
jgi:hypothetical protein